jgi:acetokinase family protein
LLDVLIRAGLILAMAVLCYRVFSPFLHLMVWALILAVTLYPLHQFLARKLGGKHGLAATLLVVVGIVLIIVPTALVQSMQPKIGELARIALGFVASIGGGVLQFLASFIIAGIIMAFGQAGSRGSLTSARRGASVASTMGFTALDWLPMGTRCGALDPGVLLYLMAARRMDAHTIETLLYHQSGLLGVSGISSDMHTRRLLS